MLAMQHSFSTFWSSGNKPSMSKVLMNRGMQWNDQTQHA